MSTKYFAILTQQGAAKLANATMLGTKLNLTHMAIGDGNGVLPTPDPAQTQLINQKRIGLLNMLHIDPMNTNQIIAEQVIPETEGGYWIREIGLYDDEGVLIAVANCPETYKPLMEEGSGRTQTIRMVLLVSSTAAVTLKIDPSIVLATRQYVDDTLIEVKTYADDLLKNHVDAANPHKQYPLIANALREMVDAGLSEDVLKNLGLGDGSTLAIGVPVPWPTNIAPTGWLKCNGATFTAAQYPKLALAYPGLVLPDLRGEFIRGWDDGRGVDSGRTLLSSQGHAFAEHQHALSLWTGAALGKSNSRAVRYSPQASAGDGGTMEESTNSGGASGYSNSTLGVASSYKEYSSSETRPVNIAFNYIVRAA